MNDMIAIYFASDDGNDYKYYKCCDGEVKYEMTEIYSGNKKHILTIGKLKKRMMGELFILQYH